MIKTIVYQSFGKSSSSARRRGSERAATAICRNLWGSDMLCGTSLQAKRTFLAGAAAQAGAVKLCFTNKIELVEWGEKHCKAQWSLGTGSFQEMRDLDFMQPRGNHSELNYHKDKRIYSLRWNMLKRKQSIWRYRRLQRKQTNLFQLAFRSGFKLSFALCSSPLQPECSSWESWSSQDSYILI